MIFFFIHVCFIIFFNLSVFSRVIIMFPSVFILVTTVRAQCNYQLTAAKEIKKKKPIFQNQRYKRHTQANFRTF